MKPANLTRSAQPSAAHGLPTRQGVSPSCVGLSAGPWLTITDFLVERFPAVSRSVWLERMAQGLMADEYGQPITSERPYQAPLRVYYYRDQAAMAAEPEVPFEAQVLYQDAHLVVADKPHFLPVTPSGPYVQQTLLVRLKNQLGLPDLAPLHRIDRETAGLVLFGVQRSERDAYQALFRDRALAKHYLAVAPFRADLALPLTRLSRIEPDEPFFRQREVPGEANSETRIEWLAQQGEQTLYSLSPVTGRKHQLRVHMNALGLPIKGDRIYPPVEVTPHDDFAKPLQLLAQALEFKDPLSGQPRRFESQRKLDWPPGDQVASKQAT